MTRQLGRKPILTFGNSSGDYPLFEFVTTGNSYPSMAFCLLCDDVERELGNAAILWVQKYKKSLIIRTIIRYELEVRKIVYIVMRFSSHYRKAVLKRSRRRWASKPLSPAFLKKSEFGNSPIL